MFTGLVEELGTLTKLTHKGPGAELEVQCGWQDSILGESIAVNGICLSVTRWGKGWFAADASAETLAKTSLSELGPGARVHLERALRIGDRVGGHFVTGHIDGVGRVVYREPWGEAIRMAFEAPAELAPFLAPKGSVAVDGVSLTVNHASGVRFDVVLVPITQSKTLLRDKPVGAKVNLEVDVLAKYVARLLGRPGVDGVDPGSDASKGGITLEFLWKQGYV